MMLRRSKNRTNQDRKFFCIGINKTGTTSLSRAFSDLGFDVDDQNAAHTLMYAYERREFDKIVDYCARAEVFQDSPFSMKYSYLFLDQCYRNAKFILTVRDDSEQWYTSLVRFHSLKFGTGGELPTVEQLRNARRPHGRSVYTNMRMRFGTSDENIYDRDVLVDYYESHNKDVMDYFRYSPEKLLVLNLGQTNSYEEYCDFVGKRGDAISFPKLNSANT